MEPMIEIKGLTKKYGSLTAVNHLTLNIYEGEVFAFLGPNGSGKTTLFLMLMGLTEPTSGFARVCGLDPSRNAIQVKRMAAYLPDTLGFYEDMSAAQNLVYGGALAGLSQNESEKRMNVLLSRVGLKEAKDKKVGQFSRGMKQRLGIADVLMSDPKVIILDEPTLGLDPDGAKELLEIITSLSKERGITVLISSHQLEHVQLIGNRIAIFKEGIMKACGTIAEMGARINAGQFEKKTVFFEKREGFLNFAETNRELFSAERAGEGFQLRFNKGRWAEILPVLVNGGFVPVRLSSAEGNLHDIYEYYFNDNQA
jgi:ABC-2 type transport system ATP-binding protein